MSSVVKSSALFLALAAFLAHPFPVGAAAFGWLGGIQLLNAAAPRFPFSRWIHWIHAMTFEVLAFLGVVIIRLFHLRERLPSGKGRPIFLIPGYMNHGSAWTIQKKRLEKLGFGPIHTIHLGHPFRSIRHYAEIVKAKTEAVSKETGRKDLILIGHSMGGLIASWYATHLAPPNASLSVITIGTPFCGTPLARLGFGLNAREMEPNSPLLQELRAAISRKPAVRFHHIATHSDQLVIPGASAALVENLHLILEDVGHASLLYSRRVVQKIYEWLGDAGVLADNRNLNP